MPSFIDSHCHLADEAFADDGAAVVERARAAGVGRALCILAAANEVEARRADALAALWAGLRFAIGVHPHQAHECAGRVAEAIEGVRAAVAARSGACAVGEIGLDYHYDFSPRDLQREVFAAQVALARELRLPIVVHTRDAEEDTLDVLRQEGQGQVAGVFHCFTGDAAAARRALDLGFHLSFSGIVTFPRAAAVREAAALVPPDRLLIETDAPYLAPVPHRGERNEPAWVVRVAEALAETRRVPMGELSAAAAANFGRLFGP